MGFFSKAKKSMSKEQPTVDRSTVSAAEAEVMKILEVAKRDGSLDWRRAQELLHEWHENATSSEECSRILGIHKAILDAVEKMDGVDLDVFRKARTQEYNLYLGRESLTDGNIDPDKLYAVCQREVAAGRMKPNHYMRILAIFGKYELAPLFDQFPDLHNELCMGEGIAND